MKASSKVLVGLAIASGLAFFFFKKSAAAEDAVPVSTGAGGGVLGALVGGAKKIFGTVSKILGGGAAAYGTTVIASTLPAAIALPSYAAVPGIYAEFAVGGGEVVAAVPAVPGSAAGGGALAVLGPALLLISPIILGPPLAKLLEKPHAEWEADIRARDAANLAEAAAAKIADAYRSSGAAFWVEEIAAPNDLSAVGGI